MSTGSGKAGLVLVMLAAAAAAQGPMHAVRVIVDPSTGARWLLARNPAHPGGPGILVPEAGAAIPTVEASPAVVAPPPLVVRAGDRLVIDESSPVMQARFTAVALAPAKLGEVFLARVMAGAAPVRVLALGPGRAALAPVELPPEVKP